MDRTALEGTRDRTGQDTVLRRVTAVAVLVSAAVHLYLYVDGFDSIDVIGPLFLLNGIGGAVIGVALLLSRHPIWVLAGVGFCAATLGAFLLSTTVGLMGVKEPFFGVTQTTAFVAELLGFVCGAVWLLRWWRRRTATA